MRYDDIEQLAPWCALNKIFGFNPALGLRLAEHFGGASEVFLADKDELALILKPGSIYWSKINQDTVSEVCLELQKLEKENCRFLCIADERFPELLKDCHDAPAGLYIKSDTPPEEIFNRRTAIGVIGTRDITSYGTEWCTKIVAAFGRAEVKPMIVSGLALGTDITAHNAALDNGLPTIAVLPTGIDTVYPFRHGWAADKIAGDGAEGHQLPQAKQDHSRAVRCRDSHRIPHKRRRPHDMQAGIFIQQGRVCPAGED